eukprot:4487438-Pyramimonas_sp.AAC.1
MSPPHQGREPQGTPAACQETPSACRGTPAACRGTPAACRGTPAVVGAGRHRRKKQVENPSKIESPKV